MTELKRPLLCHPTGGGARQARGRARALVPRRGSRVPTGRIAGRRGEQAQRPLAEGDGRLQLPFFGEVSFPGGGGAQGGRGT
jgi:hypothetical protein